MTLAEKHLRLRNKYEYKASFTFPGNPALLAGCTVEIEDFGVWSGKYMIKTAARSVSKSVYTTQITLRRGLEGY